MAALFVGSKRMKPHGMGFTIFISIFFLVGFGLLSYGVHSFFRGRQALSWPTVEGRLLECRLHENPDGDGSTWEVKVRYSYSVAGGTFEGKRVAFGYSGSSNHEEHQGIYEKLKSASQVMVRYQPGNPSSSVLAAGLNRSTFLILPRARFFGILSVIWLCVSLCASLPFWDGWPESFGYLEWLCGALLVPQPVFVVLAVVFLLTERPRAIVERHRNPDYEIRKLY